MAGPQNSLQPFLLSLAHEKADNLQTKELELARTKNKLHKGREKERKQKQRVREMVANFQATRDENDHLRSEILRIQKELDAIDEDMDSS